MPVTFCLSHSYVVPIFQTCPEHLQIVPHQLHFCFVLIDLPLFLMHEVSVIQYRYGPALICHIKNHTRQVPQGCLMFFRFIVCNRDKGAIPWAYVVGPFSVSELSVGVSIPKSLSPCIQWDSVVWFLASCNAYSCTCPSVRFCASFNSWVGCHKSQYTMLTWLHQAILHYGDCPTPVTS